jgi:thiosulfate/3-mercaptopyruvate sulfurtransferase
MQEKYESPKALICTSLAVVLAATCACSLGALSPPGSSASIREPWAASQLVTPAALAKELAGQGSKRPRVVCVGFEVLYRGAHIPEAKYAGPTRQDSGLASLRAWAAAIRKNTPIVIYCGCCPMKRCPNVRPAFDLLRREGFTRVRVLDLPDSFAKDWVEKGYPTIRGE